MGTVLIQCLIEIQCINGFRLVIDTLAVLGNKRHRDIKLFRIRIGKEGHLHKAYRTGTATEGVTVTVLCGICQFNRCVI